MSKKEDWDKLSTIAKRLNKEKAEIRQQRNDLLAALKKYGRHIWNCNREINGNLSVSNGKCTCGLLDAIAKAEK